MHPAALIALATLLVNDHALKAAWPGLITGKLSDVAGLVFFPLLVVSAWELAQVLTRRWRGPSPRALEAALVLTATGFALAKALPPAAEAVGWGLGLAQWLLLLPGHLLLGASLPSVAPAVVIADPTDLLALPALLLAAWVGTSRLNAPGGQHSRTAAASSDT